MSQMQEALVLGQQLNNTADSLGFTPEAIARKKSLEASKLQAEEFIQQAPTRATVAKQQEIRANSALRDSQIQKATEEYFTEIEYDPSVDPMPQFQAYANAMRDAGLYNPIKNMEAYTRNLLQTESFYEAKSAAGQSYAKNIAKVYEGSMQSLFSLEGSNPEPAVLQEGANNLTVGMNDAFQHMDEDISMSLNFTGKYDSKGNALYDLNHTDMAEAVKYDKNDNHKFSTVTKSSATLAEIQQYSSELLAGQLASAPSAYVMKEQKRIDANTKSALNPDMLYSFKSNGVLGAYAVTNEKGVKSVNISKGGSGSPKTGYGSIKDALDAADSVKLTEDEAMQIQNMYSAWYAEHDGQSAMPQSFIDKVDQVARSMPSVRFAMAKRSGKGSKDTGKVVADAQKVIANTLTSESSPETRKILQGAAGMYGAQLADLGYSPDQIASLVLKSEKDYGNLSELEQENRTFEEFVNSYVALAVSGGGKPGSFNFEGAPTARTDGDLSRNHTYTKPTLRTLQQILRKSTAARRAASIPKPTLPPDGVLPYK